MQREERDRKVRSDKRIRVNASLSQDTHDLLAELALACSITKTSLAAEIIDLLLRDQTFVNFIQNKHGADKFRVIPAMVNGEMKYVRANP